MTIYVYNLLPPTLYTVVFPEDGQVGRNVLQNTLISGRGHEDGEIFNYYTGKLPPRNCPG